MITAVKSSVQSNRVGSSTNRHSVFNRTKLLHNAFFSQNNRSYADPGSETELLREQNCILLTGALSDHKLQCNAFLSKQ